jgi:pimeloyl-ACP methyl ester carboxylesterase
MQDLTPDFFNTLDQYFERLKSVANCQAITLPDCGQMLHHDQPELLARAIKDFLSV